MVRWGYRQGGIGKYVGAAPDDGSGNKDIGDTISCQCKGAHPGMTPVIAVESDIRGIRGLIVDRKKNAAHFPGIGDGTLIHRPRDVQRE